MLKVKELMIEPFNDIESAEFLIAYSKKWISLEDLGLDSRTSWITLE